MPRHYNAEEIERTLTELRTFFDIVRVVEPVCAREQYYDQPVGQRYAQADHNCHAVWDGRSERCLNCISLRALQEGQRQTKYEFTKDGIFYIIAVPAVVEGTPVVVEMVSSVNDQVLLNAYGKHNFVNRITAFNERFHRDDATGLFNRHYFDEKLFLMANKAALHRTDVAVAMMDVDGYEHVSTHFGGQVADEAIMAIGRLLSGNISGRRGDFAARYGANTFVLVLDNIPRLLLRERLVELVQRVTTLRLMGYEDIRLNISTGVFLLSENRDIDLNDIPLIITHRAQIARAAGLNRIAFSDC